MLLSIRVLFMVALATGLSAGVQRAKTSDARTQTAAPAQTGTSAPLVSIPIPTCAASIEDQANPGTCLQASSVPMPGKLFPPAHDGGVDNVRSGAHSFLGGGKNNVASGTYSTVGGGYDNSATDWRTTIGGGEGNLAFNDGATIGGGYHNQAGQFSTIAGGMFNVAQEDFTTVGGGVSNTAWDYYATVAGGLDNSAQSDFSAVGGGAGNHAGGVGATVPGGTSNFANGEYSFAAGRRAIANHDGSFVWGDTRDFNKLSSADDEFSVFASGGVRFFTNQTATTGVVLAPGGGSWSSVSDRDAKENLEPVDVREVLELVAGMPVWSWNYKSQADSIRHMGPMAQDFHAAFGLGVSEKLIDTIDPDGVALAAIQGLKGLVDEKDAEIAELRERVARLEGALERLAASK